MVRHGDLLKEAMISTVRGPSTLSAASHKENLLGGTFNGPQQIVYHRGPYTTIGEIIDCPKVPPSSLQYPNSINSLGNIEITVVIVVIIVVLVVTVIIVKEVLCPQQKLLCWLSWRLFVTAQLRERLQELQLSLPEPKSM